MRVENLKRVVRQFTMHTDAPPESVFPLLCPVREYDWIETWKCEMVHSISGFAELDCIFRTHHGDVEEVWTVSRYEPDRLIEFIVNSRFRLMRYSLVLEPEAEMKTKIAITQTATALDKAGESHVEDPHFDSYMKCLELMLNHYLKTGTRLPNEEAIKLVQAGLADTH